MSDEPIPAPPGGDIGRDTSSDRKAGFEPMRHAAGEAPRRTEKPSFETSRQAGEELARKRRNRAEVSAEPREVFYQDTSGDKIPEREIVTEKRAGEDLAKHRYVDAATAEIDSRDELARKVDAMRAKAGVPTDPTLPVDNTQFDPHLFGDLPRQAPQIDPQHLPPDLQPAPPGIDPDLHRAFSNPKVRAAVEKEVNQSHEVARTAQQHYAENVVAAQEIALGSINAAFPEMAGVKTPQDMQRVLQHLQATNPQRAQQAQAMLQNFARLHGERQNMETQRQQFQRQQFQRDAVNEDAAYAKRIGHIPAAHREAVSRHAIEYAQTLGVSEQVLTHLLNTNPILRTAAFRQVMFDAAAGSLARKNLEVQRQKQRSGNVPHIQPPGHSNGGGVRAVQNANLQALSSQLTKSGSAKDAAALLLAMRNSRKRG
jgi:hypothetical protein